MLGWGLGLTIHAFKVYVNDGALGRRWEERKLNEFMREEDDNRWK